MATVGCLYIYPIRTTPSVRGPSVTNDSNETHSAGRLWTQAEAAAYLNVSPRYLRASACPKMLLPGTGRAGKPLVRYDPAAVHAWATTRSVKRRFG
jgi:hypothetical protein